MSETASNIYKFHGSWKKRWGEMPRVLRAYSTFAAIASLFFFGVLVCGILHVTAAEEVYPLVGWTGLFPYVGGTDRVVRYLHTGNKASLKRLWILMALFAVFGPLEQLLFSRHPTLGERNPYLAVSNFRWILVGALPAAWSLLLLSDSVRRWHASPQQA